MNRVPKQLSADQGRHSTRWYVVATKGREEKKAQLNLERQGYSVFLPQLSLRKRRNGQWEITTQPLFPCYLFISLALGEDDPAPIRSTMGCVGLVRFGHTYTSVPAELITCLQSVAASDHVAPAPFVSGNTVRLVSGPFAGLEAIFDTVKGKERAQVLPEVLGRIQRLNVELDSLGDCIDC